MFDLTGRTIVITGGSRGIGLGMAQGLAAAGARLSLWSRGEPDAEALRLQEQGEVQFLRCDVASEVEVDDAFAEAAARFGPLHGCIANAGTGGGGKSACELDAGQWRRVLATNLDGAFYTLRAAARRMRTAGIGDGRLVAVTSLAADIGAPSQPEYAASKAAVAALVRSMAVELGACGITVNAIAPGWIETGMNAAVLADKRQYEAIRRLRIPAGRWGKPEDLAGLAVYLMSAASSYHTGDTLTVDGGYRVF